MDRKAFPDKTSFEAVLLAELEQRQIEMVVLAGFMRILSDNFVKKYLGRLINIHPSYLPAFKGTQAIKDAFKAKVAETILDRVEQLLLAERSSAVSHT